MQPGTIPAVVSGQADSGEWTCIFPDFRNQNRTGAERTMAYEKILFDLDGTLTESGPGITHAVQYALQQVGIEEPDRAELECFVGPPLNVMFRQRYGMDDETSAEAIKCFRKVYDGGMIFENRVYEGIPELLQELHEQGIQLAIASSKPLPMVHKVLEHFGLEKYFDVIVGGKPSAEEDNQSSADHKLQMVKEALMKMGVENASQDAGREKEGEVSPQCSKESRDKEKRENCAMVGDRCYDIKGALFNHVTAIGVTYGYGSREELEEAGADCIAESVTELRQLLNAPKDA